MNGIKDSNLTNFKVNRPDDNHRSLQTLIKFKELVILNVITIGISQLFKVNNLNYLKIIF